jgi:Cdc6-like AAA superfamily ATPase
MPPTETEMHPIEQAQRHLSDAPIKAVDAALQALRITSGERREAKTRAYLDILAQAVLRVAAGENSAGEDPVIAMLKLRSCDRLACATLLRVLILNDDVFAADSRLRDASALFDRTLANTLYPVAGITRNSQAFEKRDHLRTLVADHEQSLLAHVSSLSSLEAVQAFRSDFGKLFRSKVTGAFVLPFLPESITFQNFEVLLSEAQSLAECADASIVGRSEVLERRCGEMKELAEEFGTEYSKALLSEFATTLKDLVAERVDAAGFADPAKLSVSLRPKRYPFGHPKVPVTVRLDLINDGPGQAQDISVQIEGGGAISFDETVRNIGLLGPAVRQIEFQGLVASGRERVDEELLMVKVTWRNPDGGEEGFEEMFTLRAQQADVPWDDFELERPYRLEPITERKEFVGRSEAVHDLARVVLESGNARIEGEKRVGKTSLANAVRAAVEEREPGRYMFLQFESGDFSAHTLEATIARLGKLIAEQVRRSDQRLADLEIPDFSPGLTMLTEYFARVQELASELRFVIVLDEFDALPHEALYRHEPVGDAFFQTLRSLGGKPNVGFILIGAERMQWVIATHGQTLNRFKLVRLDYFSADQLSDYAALVRDPVADLLHFSEEAIDALHEASAGNPWMTKLLLRELFERQVERRDQDVQADDVYEAIEHALPDFGTTSFQHFWDDAIRGEVEQREHVSAMRRRVLLAMARCQQGQREVTEANVLEEAKSFSVDEATAQETVREFLDRKILVRKGSLLTCRVPLFERWLARYGTHEIILGTGGEDALLKRQLAIEEMRPTVGEMEKLAKEWKSYRGRELRPEQILSWLEQFGGPENQRLIVPILEGLRFYTRAKIDESLRDLHQYLLRELASRGYQYKLSGQQRSRGDLLVCGLEGGGSGATHLLKQYREENGIYKDCVVDASNVRQALRVAKTPIKAVIVIEDFMGTGNTAAGRLQELYRLWTAEEDWPGDVNVFLLTITAFDSAVKRVEGKVQQFDWSFTTYVRDVLEDRDRCFHKDSRFYSDASERETARELCKRYGSLVSTKGPLGYGKTEAAVCFEYRCPNNTLPVLWSGGDDWRPLFPRLT